MRSEMYRNGGRSEGCQKKLVKQSQNSSKINTSNILLLAREVIKIASVIKNQWLRSAQERSKGSKKK